MAADHVDVPLRLSRTEMIRLYLNVATALTTEPPVLRVPLDDLPLWAAQLYAEDVALELRHDGRVRASIVHVAAGKGLLIVEAVADLVRDMELPPFGSRQSVRLPVTELSRLESFAAVENGAA